uniref:DNA topoisomerase 3-alpha n=1 Tax=Anthurium amnicola TaxID=1678845 RepID=A0A1D1YH00_9ARAE
MKACFLDDGNFMVGCLRFPQCRSAVWLPGAISEAVVTSNICSTCSPGPVFMIQFKFRRLEIPPNYDVDHLGCIGGCDMILRDLTEICGTGPRNLSSTTARGSQSMEPPNSGLRRNSRQDSQVPRSQDAQHSRGPRLHNGRLSITCDKCGETCVMRTANTASNRGRKFYTCQSQECNFFVWEDELDNDGTRGRGGSRGNSRSSSGGRRGGRGHGQRRGDSAEGTFVTTTGDPVSGRCYICGDPSHFANVCPNRGS